MAVYTHVSDVEIRRFLEDYDIGVLKTFQGIAQGVENTNYRLETDRSKFILTLFEKRVAEHDLPFFIGLMSHLAEKGLPAPLPIAGKDGDILRRLCGRPVIIVTHLDGAAQMTPSPAACAELGDTLAHMHTLGADFPMVRGNALGPEGWRTLAKACIPRADECAPGLAAFVQEEADYVLENWPIDLPAGVIHADLFPDNVFFEKNRLTGVIDFYFSCTDYYAYDIAVCLNSWANGPDGWSPQCAAALLENYQQARPLTERERASMPVLLRGAALRFLLTRLYDWLNRVEGALVTVKDPLEYRDLIAIHRQQKFSSKIGYKE